VLGAAANFEANILNVQDPSIIFGAGNPSDAYDLGIHGQYVNAGTRYSGFFRDASAGTDRWKLYANLTSMPQNFVDTANISFNLANLELSHVIGRVTQIDNFTTTDLVEGSNLYYTDVRVWANVGANIGNVNSWTSSNSSNIGNLNSWVRITNANIGNLNSWVATNQSNLGNVNAWLVTTNSNLGNVNAWTSANSANIGNINSWLRTTNANVGNINGWLTTTNSNVGNINSWLTATNANIGTINSNLGNLNAWVVSDDANIGNLNAWLVTTSANVGNINGWLTTTNSNVGNLNSWTSSNSANIGNINSWLRTTNSNIGNLNGWVSIHNTTSGIVEGTNLYFTNARARAAVKYAVNTVSSGNYTLSLLDDSNVVYASNANVVVPDTGTVGFSTGTEILVVTGAGSVIVDKLSGATSVYLSGNTQSGTWIIPARTRASLVKLETEVWLLDGRDIVRF
jgi:hypothetical protein